jgi:ADP-ribose pyrophosphatase
MMSTSDVDGDPFRAEQTARLRHLLGGRVVERTDPEVLTTGVAAGWADAESDPTLIDWPARQARAWIRFAVVAGRPVSPVPGAVVSRGRGGLGRWGENRMADALVVAGHAGVRHVLLVERADGAGWAMPGGAVEPGETSLAAAARELAEETGLVIDPALDAGPPVWSASHLPRWVPDPRGTDEAWAVTCVATASLGVVADLPEVVGGDDAARAAWVEARSYPAMVAALAFFCGGTVFAAHEGVLRAALGAGPDRQDGPSGPVGYDLAPVSVDESRCTFGHPTCDQPARPGGLVRRGGQVAGWGDPPADEAGARAVRVVRKDAVRARAHRQTVSDAWGAVAAADAKASAVLGAVAVLAAAVALTRPTSGPAGAWGLVVLGADLVAAAGGAVAVLALLAALRPRGVAARHWLTRPADGVRARREEVARLAGLIDAKHARVRVAVVALAVAVAGAVASAATALVAVVAAGGWPV